MSNNIFTYNLRTPKDFPIEAKNMMDSSSIIKGTKKIEASKFTNPIITGTAIWTNFRGK